MKRQEYEVFANRVILFYESHNKKDTVKDFLQEGAKRTSVYRIIRRYEETG